VDVLVAIFKHLTTLPNIVYLYYFPRYCPTNILWAAGEGRQEKASVAGALLMATLLPR